MSNSDSISPTPLSADSSTPLYLQLSEALRHEISSGMRPAGSQLPTESALCELYHVSRVTVRKALECLEKQAYIERKSGKGTFVKQKKLKRNLSSNVLSFTKMCEQMGSIASSRTIQVSLRKADSKEAENMNLNSGDQLLFIERVRYADEEAVMIERDFFTEDFDFLFTKDLNHNSLYELIRREKGIVFSKASRTIDIVFASSAETRLLHVKTGYPLLRISAITWDETESIITLSEQLCIGDKFRLQV